ncbi:MAG: hypothetical protein HY660_13225 [Armatimonadetes bacterium]|nr:hypothetical protein [Armatimonadota bacterium]
MEWSMIVLGLSLVIFAYAAVQMFIAYIGNTPDTSEYAWELGYWLAVVALSALAFGYQLKSISLPVFVSLALGLRLVWWGLRRIRQ